MLCELTYVCAPASARAFSLYTCINSQAYICSITNTLVYEPMSCKLTYVCALASAHT